MPGPAFGFLNQEGRLWREYPENLGQQGLLHSMLPGKSNFRLQKEKPWPRFLELFLLSTQ